MRNLVTTLSELVTKHDPNFMAFLMFVDGEPEDLKKLNASLKADNVALCIVASDSESTRLYKIDPATRSTLFLYDQQIIKAKFVDYDAEKDEEPLRRRVESLLTP